jgi:alpha-1,2-mannosyltransferase
VVFDPNMRGTRQIVALGVLVEFPLLVLGWLALKASWQGDWYHDFLIFRRAGDLVLHGHSPYVAPTAALLAQNDKFVYPTPFAFLFAPFALLPLSVAKASFTVLSIAALAAALRLLGVRDWRCYAAALLGGPVLVSFTAGTIGPVLLLLVAAAWRYRDRAWAGVLLALAAAFKLLLWPVLVWLLATRRLRASLASLLTLAGLAVLWVAVDLEGLRRYPSTLRVLNDVERWKSYSAEALSIAAGLGSTGGEALTVGLALVGAGAVVLLARRRDGERRAFAAAATVALLSTPILWSHYLILLLVPVALVRPRLAPIWFVPVGLLLVTPAPDSNGTAWKMAVVLAATLLVGLLAVSPRFAEARPRPRRLGRRKRVPRDQVRAAALQVD